MVPLSSTAPDKWPAMGHFIRAGRLCNGENGGTPMELRPHRLPVILAKNTRRARAERTFITLGTMVSWVVLHVVSMRSRGRGSPPPDLLAMVTRAEVNGRNQRGRLIDLNP